MSAELRDAEHAAAVERSRLEFARAATLAGARAAAVEPMPTRNADETEDDFRARFGAWWVKRRAARRYTRRFRSAFKGIQTQRESLRSAVGR